MSSLTRHSLHQITLECSSCEESFVYNSFRLSAGSSIVCPHCRISFLCCSKELFAALKHLDRLAS